MWKSRFALAAAVCLAAVCLSGCPAAPGSLPPVFAVGDKAVVGSAGREEMGEITSLSAQWLVLDNRWVFNVQNVNYIRKPM